jgi:hypothetical protein
VTGNIASIGAAGQAAASRLFADARARAAAGAGLDATGATAAGGGPVAAPAPTEGTGHDRDVLDGVTWNRPFEVMPTLLTNLVEKVTGERDDRMGRAISQVLLAGLNVVQAGLRSAAQGTGAVAVGSSVLGKVLPVIGIGSGVMQVWKGWNELQSHDGGPLSLIGSRTARTGMLQVLAGALMFIPGVGPLLGSAGMRMVAAANELDAFHSLDAPTRKVEEAGAHVARTVHVFDQTPTDPFDRTRRVATAG